MNMAVNERNTRIATSLRRTEEGVAKYECSTRLHLLSAMNFNNNKARGQWMAQAWSTMTLHAAATTRRMRTVLLHTLACAFLLRQTLRKQLVIYILAPAKLVKLSCLILRKERVLSSRAIARVSACGAKSKASGEARRYG